MADDSEIEFQEVDPDAPEPDEAPHTNTQLMLEKLISTVESLHDHVTHCRQEITQLQSQYTELADKFNTEMLRPMMTFDPSGNTIGNPLESEVNSSNLPSHDYDLTMAMTQVDPTGFRPIRRSERIAGKPLVRYGFESRNHATALRPVFDEIQYNDQDPTMTTTQTTNPTVPCVAS